MAVIETVEVNRNGVKVIINKSDFDPKKESLWSDKLEQVKQITKPKPKTK